MGKKQLSLPPWLGFKMGTWVADKLTKLVESKTPPDLRLIDVSSAHEQAQCLYVAARLGVADVLTGGPRSAENLAAAVGADADMLARVMRYLHELGIFGQDTAGRFSLSSVSEFLVTDHPESQRDIVLLSGEESYRAFGQLYEAVVQGENAFALEHGKPFYAYHDENQERAEHFDRAMVSVSALPDKAVAADCDFSRFDRLADLGSGRGNLMREILTSHGRIEGVLFDRPAVLNAEVQDQWRADPLGTRVELRTGDFFEAVPADVDAYVVKDVVHNWPDEEVVRLYERVRADMRPDATLLVVEMVVSDDDPLRRVKLNLDVNMMVIHSGRERTEAEHRALLSRAGFSLVRVQPTRSIMSVLEARAHKPTAC